MDLNAKPTSNSGKTKKKRSRVVQIFKLSLFMLRRPSKKSKASVDMGSDKSLWRRLLDSIRPLHIQGDESPLTVVVVDTSLAPKLKEVYKETPIPLPSSSPFSLSTLFSCTSSSSSSSQYAFAANLQELDENSKGDNDENDVENDNGGDEMIDAKAEEFIAQFYEQMRRQRCNY